MSSKKKPDKPDGYIFGRPTKYKEEYIKAAYDYVEKCIDTEKGFVTMESPKSSGYMRVVSAHLPTIEEFALELGVVTKTLYNWGEENPDFLQALEYIKQSQFVRLTNKALSRDYSEGLAKLILMNNHGMANKEEVETTEKTYTIKEYSDE